MTGVVYTLELEDECWYVGYTKDPSTRIASHFLKGGSKWTIMHPPIAVTSVVLGDELLENLATIALMCRHGWEKVRGGNYCAVNMTAAPQCIKTAMQYAQGTDELIVNGTSGAHTCQFLNNPEGGNNAWRAYIRGPKASRECLRGVKTIYAPTEQALHTKITAWAE